MQMALTRTKTTQGLLCAGHGGTEKVQSTTWPQTPLASNLLILWRREWAEGRQRVSYKGSWCSPCASTESGADKKLNCHGKHDRSIKPAALAVRRPCSASEHTE